MIDKLIKIFDIGGPLMIPIALLAIGAILIFIERLLYLHRGQIRCAGFVSGIKTALKNNRLLEAITLCDDSYGPIPRVVKTVLLNVEAQPDVMYQATLLSANNEFNMLQRRVASLALIARIAPLLGLIGTIIALLEIFYNMGLAGSYVNASEFSTQIYNAMISSAFGLTLSVIVWLAHSFLNSKILAISNDIDWAANTLMLFIIKKMPKEENLHIESSKE